MTASDGSESGTHRCPECDEPMLADQEWRLREGLAVGRPASSGDYVHASCYGGAE